MNIEILSLSELKMFAKKIATNLKGGETIALIGNLGAGKTTFTKLLLKASGVRKNITSPTFVIMLPYKTKHWTFYHIDLYRIGSYKEVQALGIPDNWNRRSNVFVIEWADLIKKHLPKNTIFLEFKVSESSDSTTARTITIKNASKVFQKNISR
ncbi:MAG: tRNA ((37)-N6)-threonylcarbamoyltransferase complex ATPase subunit type 1 TsaE [Candidatus Doudnabacteria bacterium]|nr:tRNA ((37)-N6)-threonylcarbamoyltransferase complex ATPase subunit type 1 TsaE [Candidatus Doudnabacteria bacterium]